MSEHLSLKEWRYCLDFALQFAQQQGWYEGVKNAAEITEQLNDGHGFSAFEQGLNIAQVSLNYWKPILSETVTIERVLACHGIDSKIREYDARLMIQERDSDSSETERAELIRKRQFIREILETINVGGCLAEQIDCFARTEQQP